MKHEDIADEELNKKNKNLYEKLRNALGFKRVCPECGEETYTKEIYQNEIMPLIEMDLANSGRHPDDYLEISDLAYMECKNCGVATDQRRNETEWRIVKNRVGNDDFWNGSEVETNTGPVQNF